MEKYLCDLEVERDFLNKALKGTNHVTKNNVLDDIQIKFLLKKKTPEVVECKLGGKFVMPTSKKRSNM